jgi:hypothetical protein
MVHENLSRGALLCRALLQFVTRNSTDSSQMAMTILQSEMRIAFLAPPLRLIFFRDKAIFVLPRQARPQGNSRARAPMSLCSESAFRNPKSAAGNR